MILIVSDNFPHINCFPFLHAFLRSVPTPEIKSLKPGFIARTQAQVYEFENGRLPGFWGTRVAFPSSLGCSLLSEIIEF